MWTKKCSQHQQHPPGVTPLKPKGRRSLSLSLAHVIPVNTVEQERRLMLWFARGGLSSSLCSAGLVGARRAAAAPVGSTDGEAPRYALGSSL